MAGAGITHGMSGIGYFYQWSHKSSDLYGCMEIYLGWAQKDPYSVIFDITQRPNIKASKYVNYPLNRVNNGTIIVFGSIFSNRKTDFLLLKR